MIIGHQRPHYIGNQQLGGEELDIINLVTLGYVVRKISSSTALSPPSHLISKINDK